MTSNPYSQSACEVASASEAESARLPRVIDPDPAILERACSGDREACRLIVERYESLVFAVAANVLGDVQEAEDAAQEAFLRVFLSLPRYRGEAAFTTWVFRVAVNAALDQDRRRRRRSLPWREVAAQLPRVAPGTDQTAEQCERCHEVLAAMGRLRPALRRPLVLREVYGLRYEEIGDLLGRPLGTVKAAVHRGRAALLAVLEQNTDRKDEDGREPGS